MRSSLLNKGLLFCFIALAMLSGRTLAQSSSCKSVSSDQKPGCANVMVEYRDITTGKLWGHVYTPVDDPVHPVFVSVYKISKDERKKDSYNLVKFREPNITIQANEKGEFCHPGVDDGYYVIKLGHNLSGFNCSWIKVRILKGSPEIKVKAEISLGT